MLTFSVCGLVLLGVLQGVLLLSLQVGIVLAPPRLPLICTNIQFFIYTSVPDPWHFEDGSGSLDPVQWITDPDPNPDLFDSGSQDAKIKVFFPTFFCLLPYLLTVTFISVFKDSKSLRSHKNSIPYLPAPSIQTDFPPLRQSWGSRSACFWAIRIH